MPPLSASSDDAIAPMGKKERAQDARSEKAAAKKERRTQQAQNDPTVPALAVTVVFATGLVIVSDVLFQSQVEGRAHFFARLFCFMLLESSFGSLFSLILLQPARRLVEWIPGGVASDEVLPWAPIETEQVSNEDTLAWPLPGATAALPADWVRAAAGRSRPYHLNHVRGTNRMKQAFMRAGAALGSLCTMTVLSVLIDRRPVAALGLGLDYAFVQVSQP